MLMENENVNKWFWLYKCFNWLLWDFSFVFSLNRMYICAFISGQETVPVLAMKQFLCRRCVVLSEPLEGAKAFYFLS